MTIKETPLNNDAIYVERMFGTSISNNYVEEFGRAGGNTTWYGIDGTVQGDAASTIAGNLVTGVGSARTLGSGVTISHGI